MAHVESVNLARVRVNPDPKARGKSTGIDKVPTDEAVRVRAPGPTGSGLTGDTIGNHKLHGGDDQAVYAYAREDLDGWETELARPISSGMFGENLTTAGVEVTGARIGERWRIGTDGLLLEVSAPRTPCRTFAAFLAAEADGHPLAASLAAGVRTASCAISTSPRSYDVETSSPSGGLTA